MVNLGPLTCDDHTQRKWWFNSELSSRIVQRNVAEFIRYAYVFAPLDRPRCLRLTKGSGGADGTPIFS
jgi:hypothetical protein